MPNPSGTGEVGRRSHGGQGQDPDPLLFLAQAGTGY